MNDIRERIANLTPQQRNLLNKYLLQKNLAPVDGLPIPRVDSTEPSILSFSQERLWVLEQLEDCGAAYHVTKLIRLNGVLEPDILEKSLQDLTDRHQSLRTYFVYQDGAPKQVLDADRPFKLEKLDLRDEDEETREKKAMRIVKQKVMHPFDLSKDFMLRATLIRLRDEEYILILVMHHIASDGWSIGILCRDLSELYKANLSGQEPDLPAMAVQYVDFSNWQRESFAGEIVENHIAYWKDQLQDAPELLELPTDHPRPSRQTYDGSNESLVVPSNLIKSVEGLSRKENVTLFMTLLSAFQTLLYRYSGSEDILVGSPIANRKKIETEEMIGFFVNTLVFRTDLSNNPTFRELLARVRNTCLGAYSHQDLPFELLVQELKPNRSLSHSSIFQVVFNLQNTPQFDIEFPGVDVSWISGDTKSSKFDMSMSLKENKGKWTANINYNTHLFEKSTIQRMLNHYMVLLNSIVDDVDQKVSELPILTDVERRQLLVDWNNTHTSYPTGVCIHEMIEAQVERTPEAVALEYEGECLTYRELNERANQLAHHLQKRGVGPEVLVGICVERSLEMVVGLLGILKAGGAYVPLDPGYPKGRLAFMMEDARTQVLLTQARLLAEIPATEADIICLDTDWNKIARERIENPVSGVTEENLAYVIFTSGSTGRPKGAMNAHRGVCNRLFSMQETYQLDETDRLLQKTPFSFDVSGWEFYWPLMSGARLVMARPGGHQDSGYLAEIIAKAQITTLHFVPSMLQIFLEERNLESCSCLRRVFSGGEALSFDLQERFFARFGAELHNLYGPAEAAIDVTSWECQRDSKHSIIPIGRPIANTQIYILDSHLQLVPPGLPGELHIGGANVGRGYLNRPELTAERFISDPFSDSPSALLYKTGDLARHLPDGNIEFLGRIDHQVKVRGVRIELGEIEAVLGEHPGIRETVVMAREDIPGDQRLVAYAVSASEIAPSTGELRKFLAEKLPAFMVPTAFVILEALPLSPNGKVDLKELPAPENRSSSVEQSYLAPQTEMEIRLASIWQKVIRMERIGILDNFFDIGGHSLLAIRLITLINQEMGSQIPLASLFESPTIKQLALFLENGANGSSHDLPGSLVPLRKEGSLPPFFCIPDHFGFGIFYRHLANHLPSDQPVYALQLPGIYGEARPLDRIEDIASYFIDLIRQIQPYGPYYLGAYCFGRLVVFEMAQQLLEEGEEIGLLGIFDHAAPGFSMKPPRRERFRMHVDRLKELNGRDKFEHLNGVLKLVRKKINRKINGLKLSSSQKELARAADRASKIYQPQPYKGKITYFRAMKKFNTTDFWNSDPCFGWDTLAQDGVEVRDVNASLGSWFDEPEVGELAKELQGCLDEAYSVRLYT